MTTDLLPLIVSRIESANSIVIFSHISPDGDAIGSALGLWWILHSMGKSVCLSFRDPAPENMQFLPGIEQVQPNAWDGEDLLLCVDGSDAERYGPDFTEAREKNIYTITIDHHQTNTLFADINWVDSMYVATAQMIYDLARHAGWSLTWEAATCLATGCVTDSNGFSTDHTTPVLLETVADLMREGAPLPKIMYYTRGLRTPTDALMWGKILSNLRIENGVAWAISYAADRNALRAEEGAGGGISTFVRDISGVKIGVMFTEVGPQEIKISMRSDKAYDVGNLAFSLGGGGHRQAAGATLLMPIADALDTVIPKVKALVM